MPLIEYRMSLLEMGTFTCVAIGDGGIIMGGCAIYGFSIGVVIPRKCFKFSVGDKAFLKSGKPVFIVKFQTESGVNFYQVDCYGQLFGLPEDQLFYLSEVVDCNTKKLSEIEKKLDKLFSIPTITPPSPGKKKVPGPKFDISAMKMLREKFMGQLEKLEEKPVAPDPLMGKKAFLTEFETDCPDAISIRDSLRVKVEDLRDCIASLPPPEGGLIFPEQDVYITQANGGIKMGGCAYVIPPAGHCPC